MNTPTITSTISAQWLRRGIAAVGTVLSIGIVVFGLANRTPSGAVARAGSARKRRARANRVRPTDASSTSSVARSNSWARGPRAAWRSLRQPPRDSSSTS